MFDLKIPFVKNRVASANGPAVRNLPRDVQAAMKDGSLQLPANPAWPQDKLVNPKGGSSGRSEILAHTIDREPFSYVWPVGDITSAGGFFKTVKQVEPNYNFWIANLCPTAVVSATGVATNAMPGIFELTDNEQMYSPIKGDMGACGGGLQGKRSTFPMPYVIRSGQSFTMTLTFPAFAGLATFRLWVCVEGWKDYSF